MPTQQRTGGKNYELLSASFIGCVEDSQHTTYQPAHCLCSTCGFNEGYRHCLKVGNTMDCLTLYPGHLGGETSRQMVDTCPPFPPPMNEPWEWAVDFAWVFQIMLLCSNGDWSSSNGEDLKKSGSLQTQSKSHATTVASSCRWHTLLPSVFLCNRTGICTIPASWCHLGGVCC